MNAERRAEIRRAACLRAANELDAVMEDGFETKTAEDFPGAEDRQEFDRAMGRIIDRLRRDGAR